MQVFTNKIVMRKMVIMFLMILTPMILIAPANERAVIISSEPLYIYGVSDPFLRAVMRFESRYDERAVNPVTKARGVLQIMPVMINDVNRICQLKGLPQRYTWKDAWSPEKSIEMWYIKQGHTNPEYYWDKAVRLWFGVGVQYDGKTWHSYYNEVIAML